MARRVSLPEATAGSLFPAHAGMARTIHCCVQQFDRLFPAHAGMARVKGEGKELQKACSPHTRGWPGERGPAGSASALFPAHAGMARGWRRYGGRRVPVPRTRGDGPAGADSPARQRGCSPHTRGWPGNRRDVPRPDLPVPRTRGDGPVFDRPTPFIQRCSPHTRGWPEGAQKPIGEPSPVPRTRGDGPNRPASGSALSTCSPHTRGWPGVVSLPGDTPGLFPAHAGMAR